MEGVKGLSIVQGLLHQAVGEIALRETWPCPGGRRPELGLNSWGLTLRPVPDVVGVEKGLRGAGEAGVLTAGMVRTARVLPMGAAGQGCLPRGQPFPIPVPSRPSFFLSLC